MPYLSWFEGGVFRRHEVADALSLGRDPVQCPVARPEDPGISRTHALVSQAEGHWWLRDLGSRNGTFLNGLPVSTPMGSALQDGDEISLGGWTLRFTDQYPGLDGVNFIEGVGDLFTEARPEAGQALILLRALELLHRSTESLLMEGSSYTMFRSILAEAVKLMGADRGFVVMINPDGTWHSLHRIGDVDDRLGLSHTVVSYVLARSTAVLSNAPLMDPRFGGESLMDLRCGAIMCAPMDVAGEIQGVLYLDRAQGGRAFSRFDLALLQAFVRQGAVALRHTELVRKALGQAEIQGEYLRLRTLHQRLVKRVGELLGAMNSSLRWIQSYAENGYGDLAAVLRNQTARVQFLVESGLQETFLEVPRETPVSTSLEALQEVLEPAWRVLLAVRSIPLSMEPVPAGTVWVAGDLATQALMGLVEPMLMRVPEGASVSCRWQDQGPDWTLKVTFSSGLGLPTPDPWTLRTLAETCIQWHWNDQTLTIEFPMDLHHTPDPRARPLLGLVTEEMELMDLFQSVAQAEDLALQHLEADPPRTPIAGFKYLVIDAKGTADPVACVDAYRRHASFATVPILVVRAPDEQFPELLASGTTDCLPDGFRWETLHHRLQVLKGHVELQRKARAAERLDSLRQMAGTLKHEINNPLAVISMQTELLARKYPDEPKLQKVMEMVDRIQVLVQVLQRMRETSVEDYPGGESIFKLG